MIYLRYKLTESVYSMEFCEKLQELRKQQGLTQEQLATALFVSRTAVSKWESGRGYPNIDSLKQLAALFSVTVDELLSCDEVLAIAECDNKQKTNNLCDLVFGLLDVSAALFLFLPLFGQSANGNVYAVSLLSLHGVASYLRLSFFVVLVCMALWGVLTLSLQTCQAVFWKRVVRVISFILNAIGTLLFIVSLQPYAAVCLFIFLIIKALLLIKKK